MTKSRRGKYYIDNSHWGRDVDSIEYGYRVPFGKIQVFIEKFVVPIPEPDICTDIVEPAQFAQTRQTSAAAQPTAADNNGASGSGKTPALAMADLVAEMAKLKAVAVTAENQEEVNTELAKLREEMTKIQREIVVEATRMASQ
ncbi:hypothetical protein ZWY2020_056836 [Hordeum vulgare]|nr:hypothetical protein ZWY2020_056836 [Hordeum vulgare]